LKRQNVIKNNIATKDQRRKLILLPQSILVRSDFRTVCDFETTSVSILFYFCIFCAWRSRAQKAEGLRLAEGKTQRCYQFPHRLCDKFERLGAGYEQGVRRPSGHGFRRRRKSEAEQPSAIFLAGENCASLRLASPEP
jgi:hypothetical protein